MGKEREFPKKTEKENLTFTQDSTTEVILKKMLFKLGSHKIQHQLQKIREGSCMAYSCLQVPNCRSLSEICK